MSLIQHLLYIRNIVIVNVLLEYLYICTYMYHIHPYRSLGVHSDK